MRSLRVLIGILCLAAAGVTSADAATALRFPAETVPGAGAFVTMHAQVSTGGAALSSLDAVLTFDDTKFDLELVQRAPALEGSYAIEFNTADTNANGRPDKVLFTVYSTGVPLSPSGFLDAAWVLLGVRTAGGGALHWDTAQSFVNEAPAGSYTDGAVSVVTPTVTFSLPHAATGAFSSASPAHTPAIPVFVDPIETIDSYGRALSSFQFVLDFAPQVATLTSVTPAGATSGAGWQVSANIDNVNGHALVVLYNSTSVPAAPPGRQTICNLNFTVTGGDGTQTALDLSDALANEITGTIDDGLLTICADDDNDGYTACGGDCNDHEPLINPGRTEITADGTDQNCDLKESCYVDADHDTYGSTATTLSTDLTCATVGISPNNLDCNDLVGLINPGVTETVNNGIDDNCDGFELCFVDADHDTYGISTTTPSATLSCIATGVANNATDCDDTRDFVHPGATEIVNDGRDENCDTLELCYVDADHDTFGTSATTTSAALSCVATGVANNAADCDDSLASIHPSATEVVANGHDDDCNGFELCYVDADHDTYGTTATTPSADWTCLSAGLATNNTDCNDAVAIAYPGAPEITADGTDENCDGHEACYVDGDHDHFGTTATTLSGDLTCSSTGLASNSTDCNDAAPTIFPGAAEICGNGIDEDCSGLDFAGSGLTRLVATSGSDAATNDCTVSACRTIQRAIDFACVGDTVQIAGGIYKENLTVPKALTIGGAGQGVTTIMPAFSAPKPSFCTGSLCPGASNVIVLQASNVALHGFTVDGDNPDLTGDASSNGVNVDARNGIIDGDTPPLDNLTIDHVTVKNVYLRGIYPRTGGSNFNIHDNTISNVAGDTAGDFGSIALFTYGGSGVFADNVVEDALDGIVGNHSRGTQFLRNHVTRSGSGVHTDNAGDGGGTADVIDGNVVTDCSAGGYGAFVFVPYIAPTVTNNHVTGCDIGLGAYGGAFNAPTVNTQFTHNTVTGPCSAGFQILTSTFYWGATDNTATLNDNSLEGCTNGVNVGEDYEFGAPPEPLDYSKSVRLTGTRNLISGNSVGVAIDSNVNSGVVDLSGSTIRDNTARGVENAGTGMTVEATCVYWGASATSPAVGPFPGNNTTSGNVNFDPPRFAPAFGTTSLWYTDADGDHYGNPASEASACGPHVNTTSGTPVQIAQSGDCDDTRDFVYPGAPEIPADARDESCDGLEACYTDADGDHYGAISGATLLTADLSCSSAGLAPNATDCNDSSAAVHPSATEVVADGIDEDCDSSELCYTDGDHDTWGSSVTMLSLDLTCTATGVAGRNGDCNDSSSSVYPGATEVVADGIDENCDTQELCYVDSDHDTYGTTATTLSATLSCLATGVANNHTDCNDASATIFPGAAEICANGIDEDCNLSDFTGGGITRYVSTTGNDGLTNDCTSTACFSIQRAVNFACPTDVVSIAAGQYKENVAVTKPLEIKGAGQVDTVIYPALSAPNPAGCSGSLCAGSSNVFLLQAANVTLHDFTIDGNNPDLSSGVSSNGTDVDARNGIIETDTTPLDNLTVHHVTVRNIFLRGIYARSAGSNFNIHHNTVSNVAGSSGSIAIFNFGGSGVFTDNSVDHSGDGIAANWSRGTEFKRNTVSNGGTGLHTDNAQAADTISDNHVSHCDWGAFVFVPYVGATVSGNEFTACAGAGIGLFGGHAGVGNTVFSANVVDGAGSTSGSQPLGALLTSSQLGYGSGDAHALLTGNTFRSGYDGIYVDEDPWGYDGTASSIYFSAPGNLIDGNAFAGVEVFNVDSGALSVSDSTITSNGTPIAPWGIRNTTTVPVAATCVYWGAAAAGGAVGPFAANNVTSGPASFDPPRFAATFGSTEDWHTDADGDAYGNLATRVTACGPHVDLLTGVPQQILDWTDCNDANAAIHPGAPEFVADGVDENCDNLESCYLDSDGDTYGTTAQTLASSPELTCIAANVSPNHLDCVDNNAAINPAAVEICDGIDNNCNTQVDNAERTDVQMCGWTWCNPNSCTTVTGVTTCRAHDAVDCNDSNACTTDTCNSAAERCDHAPLTGSSACSFEGHVYYNASSGGATPIDSADASRPVPDVVIAASGSATGTSTTDVAGAWAFSEIAGSITFTPQRREYGGTDLDAITSFDASKTAKYTVGLVALSARQLVLADVSANGRVTAFDASLIAQFSAMLITSFPASAANGPWVFFPVATTQNVTTPGMPAFDFAAGMYGDVTLDWAPPTPFASAVSAQQPPAPNVQPNGRPAIVYLAGTPRRLPDGSWDIVLGLSNSDGIVSLDISFEHAAGVTLRSARASGIASGMTLVQNDLGDRYGLALYSASALVGTGEFLHLNVVAESPFVGLPFTASIEANEGQVPVAFAPGAGPSGAGRGGNLGQGH